MRYKVDFKPADLLCPKSLEWVPFHRIKAALDADPRTILSEVPAAAQGLLDDGSSTAEHSRPIDAEVCSCCCYSCGSASQRSRGGWYESHVKLDTVSPPMQLCVSEHCYQEGLMKRATAERLQSGWEHWPDTATIALKTSLMRAWLALNDTGWPWMAASRVAAPFMLHLAARSFIALE